MMGMGNGLWAETKLIVPFTITNAASMSDWIDGLNITAAYALIVRDDWQNMASSNGTLIVAQIYSGVKGVYIRFYNRGFNGGSNWTTSYDLSANIGDTYTLLQHN